MSKCIYLVAGLLFGLLLIVGAIRSTLELGKTQCCRSITMKRSNQKIEISLIPLYHMPDGTWVRRPLWNPPRLEITRPTDDISLADRERLMADPQQRQFLKSLELLPDSFFQPKPDWLGWRTSQNQTYPQRTQYLPANWLLAATTMAFCPISNFRI